MHINVMQVSVNTTYTQIHRPDDALPWDFFHVRCHIITKEMYLVFFFFLMAIINKSTNKCWRGCGGKGNPRALLVGMHTGAATVENSVEFPKETKNGTAV